ncbi:MAG TPA: GNAT family N-acetyltransferase [Frankiaceae bacterium]|nr:GNAT family N-acetyltransferase [Frankiaceae bacterium]
MPTETTLHDAAGARIADLLLDEADGARWCVLLATHAPTGVLAPALLTAYSGYRVVTKDDELVGLLVGAGARIRRRAHDYEFDLAAVPAEWAEAAAPPGFRLSREMDPVALGPAKDAANPPGHPDHETGMDHVADLRELLSGAVIGANVPAATWQVSDGDGPCGGIVVSERAARDGGTFTWVLDVFVHPRHQGRGLGGVLLRRALAGAAAAGYPRMGLVVTDGNPARAVYDRVGFRLVSSGTSVDVP